MAAETSTQRSGNGVTLTEGSKREQRGNEVTLQGVLEAWKECGLENQTDRGFHPYLATY